MTCDPNMCIMDPPGVIACNSIENYVGLKGLNLPPTQWDLLAVSNISSGLHYLMQIIRHLLM